MKEKFILILIIIFALALRLGYVSFLSEKLVSPTSDGKEYDRLAWNLVTGNGYVDPDGNPTSRRAPLAPAFFALIYAIFGHSIIAARIAQAFLGTLTCLIVYLIGKDIFTEKVGLMSSAIAAIYPSFIHFTGMLFSETLLLFLIVSSLYLLLKKNGSPSINCFLSGMAFGLAALTRASILPLPFVILFTSIVFKTVPSKVAFKKALILITAVCIVISPWTVRNYHVNREFIPVNIQLGIVLLASYFYPETGFGFQDHKLESELAKGIDSESGKNRILTRYTVDNVMKNPSKFMGLPPLKFLWFWEPFGGRDYGLGSSYNVVYGLTFLFFIFGLFGLRTMWKDALPLYTVISYFVIVSLVFYASRRFRMQAEPFIIILASYGVFWTAGRWKRNKLIRTAFITGVIANLLFFLLADNVKAFSKKAANIFGYNAFSEYIVEKEQ